MPLKRDSEHAGESPSSKKKRSKPIAMVKPFSINGKEVKPMQADAPSRQDMRFMVPEYPIWQPSFDSRSRTEFQSFLSVENHRWS